MLIKPIRDDVLWRSSVLPVFTETQKQKRRKLKSRTLRHCVMKNVLTNYKNHLLKASECTLQPAENVSFPELSFLTTPLTSTRSFSKLKLSSIPCR
jgi:hypothetical protein